MRKAIRRILARNRRPRGRNDEHGFHDQREAAENMWERYGSGGSGF